MTKITVENFDYGESLIRPWFNKMLDTLEEIRDDTETPNEEKGEIIDAISFSFHYPDSNCPDCLGELGENNLPRKGRTTNYPYRVEAMKDDSLIATYECRNCGYIYQVGYAKGYHLLQFG
jgi:hypothetical protein